jgi:predicted Zn-dependent protease
LKLRSKFSQSVFGLCLSAAAAMGAIAAPSAAHAQGMIRDTEVERVLRSYLNPVLGVAGLQPQAVGLHIIGDPSINAFVADGQNMFINTGLIMQLDTPNQVIGVMAHETGHITGGHLVRTMQGAKVAAIPMLLSMAVGVAAMAMGAGQAGMGIMMMGQQIAQRGFLAFSRTQEASADQSGLRYLTLTKQSGQGMLEVFKRFENQQIMLSQRVDPFAQSHPAPVDRIANLQRIVDASPYRDIKDSPASQYAYDMMRAKLRGYIDRPEVTLRRYPVSDTSKPARYARTMAYFRQPNMASAMVEIQSLLKEEPDNPFFLEMYGQVNVEMGKVEDGIGPYIRASQMLPDSALIRVALGAAMLGTENPKYLQAATKELQTAVAIEPDNGFGWHELSVAYARAGNKAQAELATAERCFALYALPCAVQFAGRSQRALVQGSTEWQRAADIIAISQSQMAEQRNGRGR